MTDYPTCQYCNEPCTEVHAAECSAFRSGDKAPVPGSWKALEKQAREEKARELGMPADTPLAVLRAQERWRQQERQAELVQAAYAEDAAYRKARKPFDVAASIGIWAWFCAPVFIMWVHDGWASVGHVLLALAFLGVLLFAALR